MKFKDVAVLSGFDPRGGARSNRRQKSREGGGQYGQAGDADDAGDAGRGCHEDVA